jgi:glycosyltransferase involved in cell wall biosynthesis
MDISVVCPFYNESQIIEQAIRQLLDRLRSIDGKWELIVVNDGSTDGSEKIAQRIAAEHPNLRVLSYLFNRGRGHALRTGINAARGEVIVTTEIDLSWGDTIVHDLVKAMRQWPDADILVASPHLPGGGYKNVPFKRVWLSRMGNHVIRACMSSAATMNTGMTRAYRREVIQSLPLSEDGKEFHLEVILKATAFGYRIREIATILEWKNYKHQGQRVNRKSSSKVNKLIVSHSLFSVFANPVRYVWAMSLVSLMLGVISFAGAVMLYYMRMVSAYTALLSLSLIIVAVVLFILGVVLKQGNLIQRELWWLQRNQLDLQRSSRQLTTEEDIDPVPARSLVAAGRQQRRL